MRYLLVAPLVLVCVGQSFGAVVTGFIPPTVSVGPQGSASELVPTFTTNEDGTFTSVGSTSDAGWDFTWDMTVKPDPFVSATFSLTNTALVPMVFVIGVGLPIAPPQVPTTVHGGSVGLTLTDANFNGVATVTDAGIPIYQGLIDGLPVLDLLDDPYLLAAPFAGGTATDSDFAGLPGPFLPSGAALATIGINHVFLLTPGDKVGFTSFFVVEAVPEFGTLSLAGVGAAVVAGWLVRRRRSAS